MREDPLSSVEKDFILEAIQHQKRLDGRGPYDYRDLKICFGVDWGCCHVTLGGTKVMVQCSSELATPKQSRPHEGMLFVALELSPMACPSWEAGRTSVLSALINRQLERAVKLSKCVDLEGLCVIAHEQVWEIRLDVHILNHQGNIVGASLLACMAALSHYRRPDVSVNDGIITVHPADEKDLLPLSLMHMPLAVSFAFFDEGKYMLVDPSLLEEKVKVGELVVTMNKHREICSLNTTGGMTLVHEQVARCTNIAWRKVQWLSELIQEAIHNDASARARKEPFGYAECLRADNALTSASQPALTRVPVESEEGEEAMDQLEDTGNSGIGLGPSQLCTAGGVGVIGDGGASSWEFLPPSGNKQQSDSQQADQSSNKDFQEDSEEEDVVVQLDCGS